MGGQQEKISQTVKRRIDQANNMARNLNGFAHRLDTPTSTFQVNDLLNEELFLLKRFSRLGEVELQANLQEGLPAILNNPSLVQFIIFNLFNLTLNSLSKDDLLTIISEESGSKIKVTLKMNKKESASPWNLQPEEDEVLMRATEKIWGHIKETETNNKGEKKIILEIPSLTDMETQG